MIKNYALIALAFVSSALFAQQEKVSSLLSSNKHFSNKSTVNSTTYNPAYKLEYEYWSGSFLLSDSSFFTYTPTCKLKTTVKGTNGNYTSKDTLIYNGMDLLSQYIYYSNNNGTWDTSYYELSTYNNAGLPSQIVKISDDNGILDTTRTKTYTYDSQNKQLTYTYFNVSSNVITSGATTTNAYDINENLTSTTTQIFDSINWTNYSKYDYFYDNNNIPTKRVYYNWDGNTNTWEKIDSLLNMAFHYWNGSFDEARFTTYTRINTNGEQKLDSFYYDSQNNLITYLTYLQTNGNYLLDYKITQDYTYDSNNNVLEHTVFGYSGSDSIPNGGGKETFHGYAACGAPAGIAGFDKNETPVLYPNPSNGILSISNHTSISKIEVYSIYGKKVYATEAVSQTIDLTNLSKGVYIVKLQNGEQIATQKIIVK